MPNVDPTNQPRHAHDANHRATVDPIHEALASNDLPGAQQLLQRQLLRAPGDWELLLLAARISAAGKDMHAAHRFLGASFSVLGGSRDISVEQLSSVMAIGALAAQNSNTPTALRLLLLLSDYCRNNRPLIGMLIARALRYVDLQSISPEQRSVVESLIARIPSEDVTVHLLQGALERASVHLGLETLHRAGVPRSSALKAAIFASLKTNRKIGRSAYFFPDAVPEQGSQFYVMAPAKSASIFVAHTLADLFGMPIYNLSLSKLTSDEFDLDMFLAHLPHDAVLHQHTPATPLACSAFAEFDIRPLVPIRNVFDTLVSLRDWRLSMNYAVDRSFADLNHDDQFQVLMVEAFPVLLRFFTSWYRAISSGRVKGIMVGSQTLVQQPAQVIQRYLSFAGAKVPDMSRIEAVLEATGKSPRKANFNPKRRVRLDPGTGYDVVPKSMIESARSSFHLYPDVDFSVFDSAL